jgi:UPF0716 protein FxsA
MGRVFLAGLATAVAEVAVFILLGQWIGFGWAVLLVLAASLAGALLLQRESAGAWRKLREVLQAGRPPGAQVVDGLVGLIGAVLLAVPGLLSGVAGALLLVPPVRRLAGRRVERRAERRLSSAAAGDLFGPRRVRVYRGEPRADEPTGAPGPTIEGEIVGPAAGEPGGPRPTPEDR